MSASKRLKRYFRQLSTASTGWNALCPAHDDHDPSLSLFRGDDGLLRAKCHAGCTTKEVLAAAGLSKRELHRISGRSSTRGGEGGSKPPRNGATSQHPAGLSLTRYAKAKKLPVPFLKKLGLSTIFINRAKVLKIPYFDVNGTEAAVRFRVALDRHNGVDQRFKWRSGSKPVPYGLWRLQKARKAKNITLVEGESDCHTLWQHKVPALGIPGASTWKPDWGTHLDDIAVIYVVIEPDAGGAAVLKWLATAPFRDRVRIVDLRKYKDPSELHIASPKKFKKRWRRACKEAVPWAEREEKSAKVRRQEFWGRCKDLARKSDILEEFAHDLRATGLVGEVRAAKLIFLVLITRLLDRPVSSVIKGPSSAGKSFLTQRILEFFPPIAFFPLTAMSDHALIYLEEPLAHRFLVLFEAAGLKSEDVIHYVRTLLSEHELVYQTVTKTDGEIRGRTIRVAGPTGLLMTTTRVKLDPELETRIFSIPVDDTREQTSQVITATCAAAVVGESSSQAKIDLGRWHDLQEWLQLKRNRVKIPFAGCLPNLIRPTDVRLRRDISATLSLVRAHAVLHQASRDRSKDGAIRATVQDYEAVHGLINDLLAEGVEAAVSCRIRATVMAVKSLHEKGKQATITRVGKILNVDKSAASRRVRDAISREYLRNGEERKGYPARLILGESLPDQADVLPTPKKLRKAWKRRKEAKASK